MNLNKIIFIGLISLYTFPQNSEADRVEVGACLSAKDSQLTKTVGSLTYYGAKGYSFTNATVVPSGARTITCNYSGGHLVYFVVPSHFSFRTCSFSKDIEEKECTKKNGAECIVYCEPR